MFFKVYVLSLCLCTGHSTRKQLSRARFFEGLQNRMENKNEENENKRIIGDFNCAMDKMERDGRNKTLYKSKTLMMALKQYFINSFQIH